MSNLPAKIESPFSASQIELIKRDICKGASDDELQKFLWECERTQLDPFARQIYSIQRQEKYRDETGNWKTRLTRSTQVSIDGLRLLAQRSGKYAGQMGPEWCGPDGNWVPVWLGTGLPAAARVAALRSDFQQPCWGVARFDSYAQKTAAGLTRAWATMGDVMIAKCAEALALRRAFPNELAGLYSAVDEPPRRLESEDGDAELDQAAEAELEIAFQDPPSSETEEQLLASIEQIGREAAKRGRDVFDAYYKGNDNEPKAAKAKRQARLRQIKPQLEELFPKS